MPATKKKPAQPVAPTPPPAQAPAVPPAPTDGLPILYPSLEVDVYDTTSKKGPLTIQWQKKALGWETEKEFQARKVKENPNTKPEAYTFGEVFHCRNLAGEKVRCNHNAHNRPFDEKWCEDLVHTVLFGQWAGPHTMPGETINGETVRISRYGRVLSGQHSMTACIMADEWLQKARKELGREGADAKYPAWAKHDHVFLETIVVKGMSEAPAVLMTVDYVKPRTAADVFYTSEVFKNSTPPDRKELCRMLSSAVDTLWTRTDAKGYRTHPEVVGFLERHKKLLQCVLHLFEENNPEAGRRISKLRLSPGSCAAYMYLMGCGATDAEYSDDYRNQEPPTEKGLDWSLWEKAVEFWTMLGSSADFMPVRVALANLVDSTPGNEDNQGLGGRGPEKLAIIAKAWERWKDHPVTGGAAFDQADLATDGLLTLTYSDLDDKGNKLPDGAIKLVDMADFYGIDCPEVIQKTKGAGRNQAPEPPPPTKEEMEKAMAEALKRRQAAQKQS